MHSITSGLSNPTIKPFTTLESLQTDAQKVLSTTNNQYILLLNTPPSILDLLTNDKAALSSISFRLTYEQSTSLLKLVPSYTHRAIAARLSTTIDRLCIAPASPKTTLSGR
ncbi:hypothetical protein ASPWEDRAFT_186425 [Aspergillus wentii DTO 134E9]|uniref:Uncharacterized protein n=1 Tax=Aspergillus wentii DTO 134E9 TaxID=1073089 RepID=A0A1L9RBB5_ASPWE|nr:uncharacterized protein ASPWEDRAFT_186425 [Aspergillus wentii DTO 134E9]OJJ32215.1 hypothetical protein ASPWEDRAFT_186425 [Aspergillus wentii DTO 134E9]